MSESEKNKRSKTSDKKKEAYVPLQNFQKFQRTNTVNNLKTIQTQMSTKKKDNMAREGLTQIRQFD